MHPKKLQYIVRDEIVRQTMDIIQGCENYKDKYEAIKKLWDKLWELPRNLPYDAEHLLSAHLAHPVARDFSITLLTALGANIMTLSILPENCHTVPLRQMSILKQCNLFDQEYRLQELNLIGVDMESNTHILVMLLSKCPHLSRLNLGGNISKNVLLSAKTCPLIELHINERRPWEEKLSSENLVEIFFGIKGRKSIEILKAYIEDPNLIDLEPAWPNLVNLSTGYCAVDCDFFVLALFVFKKLGCFSSSSVLVNNCLKKYLRITELDPALPRINMGKYVLTCIPQESTKELETLLSTANTIDNLVLLMYSIPDQYSFNNFQKLRDAFLNPKRELHIMHLRHISSSEPPRGYFSCIGQNVKKLEIEGGLVDEIDLTNLGNLLLDFPVVESLILRIRKGMKCEQFLNLSLYCFPNITSLTIGEFVEHENCYSFLFQMFPNINELILIHSKPKITRKLIQFKRLLDLRIVKISDWMWVNLSCLLELPRQMQTKECFELHAPIKGLSGQDVKRISNSGWNFYPTSEYCLQNSFS